MNNIEKKNEAKRALTAYQAIISLVAFGILNHDEQKYYTQKVNERFKAVKNDIR